MATGSIDTTIKLWNVEKLNCVATLSGHKSHVYGLIELPNKILCSGSHDRSIKFWDYESKALKDTMTSEG